MSKIRLFDGMFEVSRAPKRGKRRKTSIWAAFALLGASTFGGVFVGDAASQETATSGSRALAVVAKDAEKCGALLVGVDEYETLTPLLYASSDVRKLSAALGEIGFPDETIRTFVSGGSIRERPSRAKILAALDEILAASGPESTVLIALSGHGFETENGDAAFCPEDVDAKTVDGKTFVKSETAILIEDVANRLRQDDAKFKLLIVDACRESASTKRGATEEARSFSPIPEANGVAFLQSCESREFSWEHPELGGGVFTHYFAEGLRGDADSDGDGGVSFYDVCSYAMTQTQRFVRDKRNAKQTPFYSLSGVADFWLKPPTREPGGGRKEEPKAELPEQYLDESGMTFQLIKPGSFMMGNSLTPAEIHRLYPGGSDNWYRDAEPRHKVIMKEPFYMARFETTVADFRRFVAATGYRTTAEKYGNAPGFQRNGTWGDVAGLSWRNPGFSQSSNHPVVCISYYDAQAYIDWLNENAEYAPELGFKPFYRLPTEAEWEFVGRAGSQTEFFWGNEPSDGRGYLNAADESGTPVGGKWRVCFPFNDRYVTTAPVGSFDPNDWGIYDMAGNALEWCADWYGTYGAETQEEPTGPTTGTRKIMRGGGWHSDAKYCRVAYRVDSDPSYRSCDSGFRVVISREP